MLMELKKFYESLVAKQETVSQKDIDSIVAERVAKLTETIRQEVESEITAELTVLDIKKQAIEEAINVLELASAMKEEVVEECPTNVTMHTNETEMNYKGDKEKWYLKMNVQDSWMLLPVCVMQQLIEVFKKLLNLSTFRIKRNWKKQETK